jgi:hypothetical protein
LRTRDPRGNGILMRTAAFLRNVPILAGLPDNLLGRVKPAKIEHRALSFR